MSRITLPRGWNRVRTGGLVLALVLAIMVPGWIASAAMAAGAAASVMSAPLYQRVNPTTGANLVTPWSEEASGAIKYGFTSDLGTPFRAATTASAGLTAVRRLYRSKNSDFTWALAGSGAFTNARDGGYVDQGVNFYAAANPIVGETEAVGSYGKSGMHRLALTRTAGPLTAAGWSLERIAFHVPAATVTPAPSPVPTQTPSPSPTPKPTSTPESSVPGGDAGALPLGQASYPVPAGAIFVSPSGSDTAAGTQAAPYRTISKATSAVPNGGTVVIRGGRYPEYVVVTKTVTIQNYPGEAVWLDGAQPVTGWVADGSIWRRDGWTTRFDSSPTFTKGAPDYTEPGWRFVNTDYPMAAHPDQVFVDGVALRQVSTRAQVTLGTFYLDEVGSRLYIGSAPVGHTVEASTLSKALSVRAPGVVVRGIGVRRYAPSVHQMGAVTLEAPGATMENVVITDSASLDISVLGADVTLRRLTVTRAGLLGIHARFADRLLLESSLVTGNNVEHFNQAPTAGGMKIGQTRGITVRGSYFSDNDGTGMWEDMSCFDSLIYGNSFANNGQHGLFLEISAKAIVADNLFTGNRGDGLIVNNTSNVQIWNNTLIGNGRPLNLVQDDRRNTDRSDPAVDPRMTWPDPQMPWQVRSVTVRNNVVAEATSRANCLLCVEDFSGHDSAEQMGINADGDVYHRTNTTSPTWLVVWARADVNPDPHVLTTLASFVALSGQERNSREYVGPSIVDARARLVPAVSEVAELIAQPLPSDLGARIGRPAGSRHLGMW